MEARAPLPTRRSERRVTDEERERTADRVRDAYELGALEHDEFEDRLSAAYAARTRSDLDVLTRDLPRDRRRTDAARRIVWRSHLTSYATVNGSIIAIWAATGGGYFWPLWPLLGWGIGLAMHGRGYRRRARRHRLRRP